MRNREVLLALIADPAVKAGLIPFAHEVRSRFLQLNACEAAELFVDTAFLSSALEAIIEQRWLHRHDGSRRSLDEIFSQAFALELKPADFLRTHLLALDDGQLGHLESKAETILSVITVLLATAENEFYREFTARAVRGMFVLGAGPLGMLRNSLYRAFDVLDDIFGLDYEGDRGMKFDARGERLFAGAGLGVQSSYLSLFIALQRMDVCDERIIDLGAGFGRVGLVLGLLFPEARFTGFEYVGHRVQKAQAAAERVGISPRILFLKQDLSVPDFTIPDADIFYLYDPFTPQTYNYVLRQIKEIGSRRRVRVVAKGGALPRFRESVGRLEGWSAPLLFDEDTLGVFCSN